MTEPIIHVAGLRFRWSRNLAPCLDIPGLEVAAGESVFLHGPSGSGKSTLLGLLGGVLIPEQGHVRLMNTNMGSLNGIGRDRFRADHIGFLFQQFNLIPYLSIIDNVLLPCRFSAQRYARATAEGRSMRQEALRLLAQLDIADALVNRPAMQLSVGQQQRVAAARALIGRPEIVIADEPTSALDAERQSAFLNLLTEECSTAGSTLLFVSHDRRLATGFDRKISLPAINRIDGNGAMP